MTKSRLDYDKIDTEKTHKQAEDQIAPDFDFDKYTFYDNETMYKIKYISDEYVRQGQINTDKIRKLLFQTIFDQVINKVNEEIDVSAFNKQNVEHWAKLFLRVKPVQKIVKEMTEKIEFELRKELIHNKQQLKAYLDFPRLAADTKTLPVVPSKEKQKLPFDDLGQKMMEAKRLNKANKKKKQNSKQKHYDSVAAIHFKKMKNGVDYIDNMVDRLENDNAQITTQIET